MKKGCRRKAINDAFTLSDVHSKNFLFDVLDTSQKFYSLRYSQQELSGYSWYILNLVVLTRLKFFKSGMYESDEVEVKICLELSCTEGQICRCRLSLLLGVFWRVRMCGCIARQWLHLAAAPICGRTVLQLQVSLYIGDFGDLYVLIINTGVSNWLLQEWLGWTILLHPQVTNWVLQAVQTNASHYMTDAIWYTQ